MNGCEGVGPHGTVQTGIVTGQEIVPKQCKYGETGITDLFTTLSDKTCNNGTVNTSNVRRGGLITAGVCPTYTWTATDNWGACSANCGGQQSRIYECRDSKNQLAPLERCGTSAPVVTRVCDGNPEAVKRSESATITEDASSSTTCPANQIGYISKKREVTTTKYYACINHSVQLADTQIVNGAWVEEKYCKDLVAYRCSQDSLDNLQAIGRYEWMVKCRAQVPMLDQFLKANSGLKKMSIYNKEALIMNGRIIYPTFMDNASTPSKVWKAPKAASGSCTVPATAYIASVCLASCATPEQYILTQPDANDKARYTPFKQAHDDKYQFVSTLMSQSAMSSRQVQKTKVDMWVTEFMDSEHQILEFNTVSGGNLRVTPNHPIVTVEGRVVEAGDFKVGQDLIKLGGERDRITSIRSIKYFGKVYNVFVKSNELHKNIVVTNGYLNGTGFFQNEGAQNLNRKILRSHLSAGALD
jgi:hypothetical protein